MPAQVVGLFFVFITTGKVIFISQPDKFGRVSDGRSSQCGITSQMHCCIAIKNLKKSILGRRVKIIFELESRAPAGWCQPAFRALLLAFLEGSINTHSLRVFWYALFEVVGSGVSHATVTLQSSKPRRCLTIRKQFPLMRHSAAFIQYRWSLRVQCLDPVAAQHDSIGR